MKKKQFPTFVLCQTSSSFVAGSVDPTQCKRTGTKMVFLATSLYGNYVSLYKYNNLLMCQFLYTYISVDILHFVICHHAVSNK